MEVKNLNTEKSWDDISLLELSSILWKQKFLIIIITISCVFIGVIFVLQVKPVYEAKAFITAPTQGDISALNFNRGQNLLLPVISRDEVYKIFEHELVSHRVQREFFNRE